MITIKLRAKTMEELEQKIHDYLQEYLPGGYGTNVKEISQDFLTDEYMVEITRFESCD